LIERQLVYNLLQVQPLTTIKLVLQGSHVQVLVCGQQQLGRHKQAIKLVQGMNSMDWSFVSNSSCY